MSIKNINVDGIDYPITEEKIIKFTTVIKDKLVSLNVSYTQELANDLKSIQGLNIEEELRNILIRELQTEIRNYLKSID